jgi:hypothetical protein
MIDTHSIFDGAFSKKKQLYTGISYEKAFKRLGNENKQCNGI